MSGYQLRLGRLFNGATGRSSVWALDDAVTLGVTEGNVDALNTLEIVIKGGPEAVLLGAGLFNKGHHLFARREVPGFVCCDYSVKMEHSGDPHSMKANIAGCPAPVMVLGGSKTSDPDALWNGTREAIAACARGVIYGRNIWQADDPIGVSRMLREMIHGSAS